MGATVVSTREARQNFSDVINKTIYGKEWVGISRRGTVVAYLIPAEVVEMFEDEMDRRAAEEISDRVERGEEETISLEEAAKELGVELPE